MLICGLVASEFLRSVHGVIGRVAVVFVLAGVRDILVYWWR